MCSIHEVVPTRCEQSYQNTLQAPEEAATTINPEVGLHALKAAHAIVQNLGRRVHCDALGERPDLRPAPPSTLCVLSNEQMIRKSLTKLDVLQQKERGRSNTVHAEQQCTHSPQQKLKLQ